MLSLSVPPFFAPAKELLAPLVLLFAGDAKPAATSRAAPIATATTESHSLLCMPLLSVTANWPRLVARPWTLECVLNLRRW